MAKSQVVKENAAAPAPAKGRTYTQKLSEQDAPVVRKSLPKTAPGVIKYHVRDLNAVESPRVHDLRNRKTGQVYSVKFEQMPTAIALEEDLALPLLNIDGFEVRTQDDIIIRARNGVGNERKYQLLNDEAVAKYTEITMAGLIRIAKAEGVTLKEGETREQVIKKLIFNYIDHDAVGKIDVEDNDLGDLEIEEVGEDEMDNYIDFGKE